MNLQQLHGMPAGSGPGSGRQSGHATRGRSSGSCRHGPVRVYTNPDNSGVKRSRRHQQCKESSLCDEAHGLPHDGACTDFHSDPAFSCRLQENSRARDTGLESQRVSSQHTRRRTGLWTDQQFQEALAAVDGGMSMRKAAATYNIPYSTFREWYYGIHTSKKKGPPIVLKPTEEEELVNYLI